MSYILETIQATVFIPVFAHKKRMSAKNRSSTTRHRALVEPQTFLLPFVGNEWSLIWSRLQLAWPRTCRLEPTNQDWFSIDIFWKFRIEVELSCEHILQVFIVLVCQNWTILQWLCLEQSRSILQKYQYVRLNNQMSAYKSRRRQNLVKNSGREFFITRCRKWAENENL